MAGARERMFTSDGRAWLPGRCRSGLARRSAKPARPAWAFGDAAGCQVFRKTGKRAAPGGSSAESVAIGQRERHAEPIGEVLHERPQERTVRWSAERGAPVQLLERVLAFMALAVAAALFLLRSCTARRGTPSGEARAALGPNPMTACSVFRPPGGRRVRRRAAGAVVGEIGGVLGEEVLGVACVHPVRGQPPGRHRGVAWSVGSAKSHASIIGTARWNDAFDRSAALDFVGERGPSSSGSCARCLAVASRNTCTTTCGLGFFASSRSSSATEIRRSACRDLAPPPRPLPRRS